MRAVCITLSDGTQQKIEIVNRSMMVMQPACKSTKIAVQNLLLPRGLDLEDAQWAGN